MLDKLRSKLVHFGPSMMSVPVKLAPFALKRRAGTGIKLAISPGAGGWGTGVSRGRWLSIHVRDIGLLWYTSVVDGRLVVSPAAEADVSFSADASDLLMIAARKQDPDTLFFQRRLVIEGDTELGLYVKT